LFIYKINFMKKIMIAAIAGLLFMSAESMAQVVVVHRAPCRVVVAPRPVIVAPRAVAVVRPAPVVAIVRPVPVVVMAPRRVIYAPRAVVLL
jgi:hypothetical protein